MSEEIIISHHQVQAYISDSAESNDNILIHRAIAQSTDYRMLFSIIDQLKQMTGRDLKTAEWNVSSLSFNRIEELILKFYSGGMDVTQAAELLAAIRMSSLMYERFQKIVIFSQHSEECTIAPEVQIQSDSQLLEIVNRNVGATVVPGKSLLVELLNRLKRWKDRLTGENGFLPQPGYALVVVSICLLAVFMLVRKDLNDNLHYGIPTDRVPYPYQQYEFRGSDTPAYSNEQIQYFLNVFKSGISNYMLMDYAGTVLIFGCLDSIVTQIEKVAQHPELVQLIRDYHFYYGLSYLALANRSKSDKFIFQHQLDNAIRSLENGISWIIRNDLQDDDKERYYAGLAYGFKGRYGKACEYLNQIPQGSPFYRDGQKLIRKWTQKINQ